jgi:hypothetical protein
MKGSKIVVKGSKIKERDRQDEPVSWAVVLFIVACVVVALYLPFVWEYTHG